VRVEGKIDITAPLQIARP